VILILDFKNLLKNYLPPPRASGGKFPHMYANGTISLRKISSKYIDKVLVK
jgi:hypothetical protein